MTQRFVSNEQRIRALAGQLWDGLIKIAHPDTLETVAEQDQVETLQLIAIEAMSTAPSPAGVQAMLDVAAERRRQVEAEGWTPEHDDAHRDGSMALAAACYALNTADDNDGPEIRLLGAELWPWADDWWKPKSPREDLVRAGALIIAEIERLDRATTSEGRADA